MEWYVMVEENNKVRAYNVFNNIAFRRAVKELFDIPELTFEEFSEEMRGLVMWQYWARAEYEITVGHWPCNDAGRMQKIDVFRQLEMNWTRFIEYVYSEYCFREEG